MKFLLFSIIFFILIGLIIPGYAYFDDSPYQQFTSGKTLQEISCETNFEKILKHNGFPACVKFPTAEKLFKNGWNAGYLSTIQITSTALNPDLTPFKKGEAIIKLKNGFLPSDANEQLNEKLIQTSMPEMLVLNEKFDVVSFKNIIPKPTNPKFAEKSIGLENLFLIKFDKRNDVNQVVSEFSALSFVDYAYPNYFVEPTLVPNDPMFFWGDTRAYDGKWRGQWGLNAVDGVFMNQVAAFDADIDGPEAWDINTGSSEIIVALVDSGIDYDHPDLAQNIWTNIDEIPNNGLDDDGNGYVDDFYGYDFSNDDPDPDDERTHGTQMASIIGAVSDNDLQMAGVAWNVKLMAVKAGPLSERLEALNYAYLMDADIVNNSWAIHIPIHFQPILDLVNAFDNAGVLLIASAGNCGHDNDNFEFPILPASIPSLNVISVAAIDITDNLSDWGSGVPGCDNSSAWGATSVDLAAPGTNTIALTPDSVGFTWSGGTSAASAFVSGAAAVLISEHPDENHYQIKARILDNSVKLGTLKDKVLSGGRLNLYTALIAPTPSILIVEFDKESYAHLVTATVSVVDTDLNLNPESVDNFDVDVWSDSDSGGIDLTVTETSENNGIFEGTVFLTVTDESSGHRLRIAEGDTITVSHKSEYDTAQIVN